MESIDCCDQLYATPLNVPPSHCEKGGEGKGGKEKKREEKGGKEKKRAEKGGEMHYITQ